jgi:hypothetical protein
METVLVGREGENSPPKKGGGWMVKIRFELRHSFTMEATTTPLFINV